MLSHVAAPQHTQICCHGAATETDQLAGKDRPVVDRLDRLGRSPPQHRLSHTMRKTLTDRLLRSLKPETAHYDVMDTIIPSMGARVLKSGKISFTLHGRFPGGGAFTRRALGGYGELSLLEAPDKAREWLKLIEKGIDPQVHEEQQRRAKERERQNTFAAVAEDFIRDKLPGERKGREGRARRQARVHCAMG